MVDTSTYFWRLRLSFHQTDPKQETEKQKRGKNKEEKDRKTATMGESMDEK